MRDEVVLDRWTFETHAAEPLFLTRTGTPMCHRSNRTCHLSRRDEKGPLLQDINERALGTQATMEIE